MRTIIRHIICESRSDYFEICPAPDVHAGNSACRESDLFVWRDEIKVSPRTLWIGMGDYGDWINRKDPRFKECAEASWLHGHNDLVKVQRDWIVAALEPIKDKCIGMVKGNHEETMEQHSERDVYGTLCEKMGATEQNPLALSYAGFIRLVFDLTKTSRFTLDIFATHGWWGGRLHGNGALNLERLAGWVDAQVIFAGHDHKLKDIARVVVKPIRGGGVEYMTQVGASCGAFLDGADYAEKSVFEPTPHGFQKLTVWPDSHRLALTTVL